MNAKMVGLFLGSFLALTGCKEEKNAQKLTFVTCADYPPFEYLEKGQLVGFDIELAKALAQELGKEAVFENMPFGSLLASLQSGQADAAISTLTLTDDRKARFDFTHPYYKESIAVVFAQSAPLERTQDLATKKIACQMGTTTQIWLTKNAPTAQVILFDNNNQVIEALKAGHVEAALIDGAQGAVFAKKNEGLSYKIIAVSDTGYGVAVQKNSPLKGALNGALEKLKETGVLEALTNKWLS